MAGAHVLSHLWVTEHISPYEIIYHGLKEVLAYKRTPYQEMWVVDSGMYGKALVLDGKWESCVSDEFLYHEALVHPACMFHGAPKSVLVLGGGEGATIREVFRWKSVERAVMVDIDPEVVAACKEHLFEMHQGAFDDPRLELVHCDALDYLAKCGPVFDIIISDLTDPIAYGPSHKLFTKEYIELCKSALRPGGRFVIQSGSTGPGEMDLHVRVLNTVRAVFPQMVHYHIQVPSYTAPWGFGVAGDTPMDTMPDPAEVDRILAEKTTGGFRMLDGRGMLALLQAPKHIRDALAKETEVYTMKDLPSFFGEGLLNEE